MRISEMWLFELWRQMDAVCNGSLLYEFIVDQFLQSSEGVAGGTGSWIAPIGDASS